MNSSVAYGIKLNAIVDWGIVKLSKLDDYCYILNDGLYLWDIVG